MFRKIAPYKNSNLSKKEQISKMFDNISQSYDRLNRIISFGIDLKWRKKVVNLVGENNPKKILDVATGTGDLAIMTSQLNPEKIIGLDISKEMLKIGKQKIASKKLSDKIELVLGDSENIPFENNYFDAITVSFGLRNFENLDNSLKEIFRVLKPKGIFVVLETAVPTKTPYKQGYQIYSKYILPFVGRLLSKDKTAYSYLSESANSFPFGKNLSNILQKNGFCNTEYVSITFGVASIYKATK